MNNTGLCTINMNGEEITLKFGIPACQYFLDKISKGYVKAFSVDGAINEVGTAYLLYAGYYNHCLIKDEVPSKSFGDFMGWIETNLDDAELQSQLNKVAECYKESTAAVKYLESIISKNDSLKKKMSQSTGKR